MKSINAPHESAGYAAFTAVQLLIEHLVEKKVIDIDVARSIYKETAERHEEVSGDVTRPEINLGAAAFARALLEKL